MAREVSLTHEEDREEYVPDVDDNRDCAARNDPADPPFVVEIEPMDGREFRKARLLETKAIKGKRISMGSAQEADGKLKARVIRTRCHAVQNYAIRDPRTGAVIRPSTGAELVDAILSPGVPASEMEILEDIFDAIVDRSLLDEGLLGKLRSVSGSCSAASAPGSAEGAPSARAPNMPRRMSTAR